MAVRFGGRTRARSQALQLMFQAEASGRTVPEVLDGEYALDNGPLRDFARELAVGCDGVRHDLDAIIATRSESWAINRMPAVDRNLLRLSLYEMIFVPEVDVPVAIDEVAGLGLAGTPEEHNEPLPFGADLGDELTGGIWYVEGPGTIEEDDEDVW